MSQLDLTLTAVTGWGAFQAQASIQRSADIGLKAAGEPGQERGELERLGLQLNAKALALPGIGDVHTKATTTSRPQLQRRLQATAAQIDREGSSQGQ